MAYNLRYYIPWSSKETQGYVYIYQFDGTDPSTKLTLLKDGISINTTFTDWNEPIIQQNAQITILNDKSNFFELLPLLENEEREYKIRIVETNPSTHTYFEGYLNSDVVEQTYLKKSPIRLVASNYIGKLDYQTPTRVENLGISSLIDTISDTLKLVGDDSSIFVLNSLCPSMASAQKQSNNSVMNLCSLDDELFWKNNIERDSGLEMLEKILKPLDSYLYWWDGNYYIERYDDLWKYPQKYVKYRTDVSYGYTTYATAVNRTDVSRNIYGFNHINEGQTISFIPGLNKIEISLNPANYSSLVKNFWDPIIDSSSETQLPQPYGSWLHWQEGDSYYEVYGPYNTISNTFKRVGYPTWEGALGTQDPCTHGASTSFRMTVPDEDLGETSMNLSWKWSPSSLTKAGGTFRLGYLLEIRSHESTGGLYIKLDKNTGEWYTTSRLEGLNIVDVDGSTLESPYVHQINISIPILDLSTSAFTSLEGDYTMVLTIAPTRYTTTGTFVGTGSEYIGDVIVSVSQPLEDNLITGTVSNKFLNKKTIGLDLFDINNFNQKNGIWTLNGAAQKHVTGDWFDDSSTYHAIEEKLMVSKWKLYQQTRQQITSTIKTINFLKPLSMWYDSYQPTKKYVLVGYNFIPTKNEYDCVWNEFGTDTSVNLNEE